jgi:putative PIN family toxin of toxin-antitoxin system
MSKLRIVLDVNVIISALLFPNSKPNQALQKAQDLGDILMSPEVWTELEKVTARPKFNRYLDLEDRQKFLLDLYNTITPIIDLKETITECRDPKDNKYLELAVSGNADYLITGDEDLLVLNPFRRINIINVNNFLLLEL